MQMMDNEKRYSFTDFLNKPSTRKKVVTNEMRQLALTIKGTEDESKIQHLVGMQYHDPAKAKGVEEKGPSFLETAVSQAIKALVEMDIRFQVKLVMEDLLTSVVQKSSESQEAYHREEIGKYQSELQKLEVIHSEKKEKRKEKEEECELKVNDLKRIEKLNMNEKVRLLCRSKDLETELGRALEQRDRFQRMKDISQLEPKLVFKVLEFLEVKDIAHIVATCRAWRFSLHKPMYWRHVRSRAWRKKYLVETTEHRVPRYPAPDLKKTKTHVVRIQRKMNELNTKNSKRLFKKRALASYNKDEIYQECITQSGKRTTAIESDREEIAEKAKVGAGLVLFMRSKMRDAMHQLGQIRVETYRQEQKVQEVRTSKQRLDLDIRAVEHEVEKQKGIIARHKEKQQKMREAQRVYEDLQMLEEPRGNEETQRMKAVKSSLVRQVVKLRKDLQRVKKEKRKFINRVDTLSQSHDFLP